MLVSGRSQIILSGIVGAAIGFGLAVLLYGQPWHLRPDIGDLATWATAFVGAAAAYFVLRQLKDQEMAIENARARTLKSDQLLEGQLRELDERVRAQQREQAERVALTGQATSRIPKDSAFNVTCTVVNNSHRPIRQVGCRLLFDGGEISANGFGKGQRQDMGSNAPGPLMFIPVGDDALDNGSGDYRDLLAGETIQAWFEIPEGPERDFDGTYVTYFTDDAGLRWYLDNTMHLERATHCHP